MTQKPPFRPHLQHWRSDFSMKFERSNIQTVAIDKPQLWESKYESDTQGSLSWIEEMCMVANVRSTVMES